MQTVARIAIAIVVVAALAPVARAGAQGTWVTTVDGQTFTLTLSADGTAKLNTERGRWSESGDEVTLVDQGGERIVGERDGDRMRFVVEGVELVFTRARGPRVGQRAAPPVADFAPGKTLKGKTVRPKGSGAKFTVPRGWKHGYETVDGTTSYVVKPAKVGDKGAIMMSRQLLGAGERRMTADRIVEAAVRELVGDVPVTVVVKPERFTVNRRDAGRLIIRASQGGTTLEGYAVGVVVDDYIFAIVGLYDASIADTMRAGVNTITASFVAKAPPENARLKKRLLGCWEHYSSSSGGGSAQSQTKWWLQADGTYAKKGFTSVSVGGASNMSEHAEDGAYRVMGSDIVTSPTKGGGGTYTVTWKGRILFLNGTKYLPCN